MIVSLGFDLFGERLSRYLNDHSISDDSRAFEAMVDRELFHRLDEKWSNGCDFEIACEFFQDRGTSILIQNLRIDWQGIWKWLEEKHREIPNGAAINFEVWDNVHEGVMKGGPMLIRRILTSEGIFEELPP